MKGLKKVLCAVLSAAVILSAAAPALADRDISVLIDGVQIEFDVPPQIINERTMVPLRAIFEALGAEVNWDGETRTVTASKDDISISLAIDSAVMYVNGKAITLDSPATIVEDRTLVPARAISEAFGSTVEWDDATSTVTILTKVSELIQETAAAVKSQLAGKINTIKGFGGSGGSGASSVKLASSGKEDPAASPSATEAPVSDEVSEYNIDFPVTSYADPAEGFADLVKWLKENGKEENQVYYVTYSPDVSLLNKFGVRLYAPECSVGYDSVAKKLVILAEETEGDDPLAFELSIKEGEDSAKCSINYKGTTSSATFSFKDLTRYTENVNFSNFPSSYDSKMKEFYSKMYTNVIKEMTFAANLALKANGCDLRTMDIGFNSMDE